MTGRPKTDPFAWRRRAAVLVDQQLWCFGYDIRRPEGNLLIERGCERIPAPVEARCGSCYRARVEGHGRRDRESVFLLRGFGVLCEEPAHAGLFLHRDRFQVAWLGGRSLATIPWLPEDAPQESVVPVRFRQAAAGLIARLAEWIACYEEDVRETCGEAYRVSALSERVPRGFIPPGEAPNRWRTLAAELLADPDLMAPTTSSRRGRTERRPARPLMRS